MIVCQTRVQRDGPGELIIGPGVQLTVSSDGHAELAGLTLNPAAPNANSCAELIGLDAGPNQAYDHRECARGMARPIHQPIARQRSGANPGGFTTGSIVFQGPTRAQGKGQLVAAPFI